VAGNVSGSFVLSTFVAFGLGPILQRSDIAYTAVQWGGGLYLIYLGINAIRHRKVHAADMTNQEISLQVLSVLYEMVFGLVHSIQRQLFFTLPSCLNLLIEIVGMSQAN
jgi:threonine/homoserine/homoserine lactone efflux protein